MIVRTAMYVMMASLSSAYTMNRRAFLPGLLVAPNPCVAALLKTNAIGREEYTNSITASRDTNISPREAYDVLREHIPATRNGGYAVDLGAGAGLSTSVLYNEKGYTRVAAVDWSRTAWDDNVSEQPEEVSFFESDDATFFLQQVDQKFDCIVYNFAINKAKAEKTARSFLASSGVLLAPCNDRADYWYKQSYLLLDSQGRVLWKSEPDVGAWAIQFQPDVTSKTCTGIWCGGINGFQQQ